MIRILGAACYLKDRLMNWLTGSILRLKSPRPNIPPRAEMPTRVVYAGAPDSKYLHAANRELLPESECLEAFRRFCGLPEQRQAIDTVSAAEGTTTTDPPASWRTISLKREHLPTGLSQIHGRQDLYEGASFLTTADLDSYTHLPMELGAGDSQISSTHSVEEILSQFYEQSYAIHEDIPSSEIAASSLSDSSGKDSASFDSESRATQDERLHAGMREIPSLSNLCDLKDVPNASYLRSMHPQTVTTNMVVGIISMSPPRSINMKRGGTVDLVEVLVGDETRSGLGINFWLPTSNVNGGGMRRSLEGLRSQDVLLIRNVALGSFQGRVYGQSLRRDMTKVYLLFRNKVDKHDARGAYTLEDIAIGATHDVQMQKMMRVMRWVSDFVGQRSSENSSKEHNQKRTALPPDTQ